MTTPYYSDGLVTLYHGDCREVTEWLAADVLVTDPPYGVRIAAGNRRDGTGGFRKFNKADGRFDRVIGDKDTSTRDAATTLWGAERPALVFGRWDAPRPAGTHKRLIWDKGNNPGLGNLRLPWGQSDEEIYLLGHWPHRPSGGPARTGSLVRVPSYHPMATARPDHPTPKPPELFVQLIERCPPGAIADPFAGSGPALLAARQLGRRVIGVEVEERYCELIARRLQASPVLPALVGPAPAGTDEVTAAGGDVAPAAGLAPFGGLGGVVAGVSLAVGHDESVARSLRDTPQDVAS